VVYRVAERKANNTNSSGIISLGHGVRYRGIGRGFVRDSLGRVFIWKFRIYPTAVEESQRLTKYFLNRLRDTDVCIILWCIYFCHCPFYIFSLSLSLSLFTIFETLVTFWPRWLSVQLRVFRFLHDCTWRYKI
jgi:hypothetical protein